MAQTKLGWRLIWSPDETEDDTSSSSGTSPLAQDVMGCRGVGYWSNSTLCGKQMTRPPHLPPTLFGRRSSYARTPSLPGNGYIPHDWKLILARAADLEQIACQAHYAFTSYRAVMTGCDGERHKKVARPLSLPP